MSIIFRLLLVVILILNISQSYGQKSENDFIEYLYNAEYYEQLRFYERYLTQIDSIDYDSDLLNFYVGKSFYHQQVYDNSNQYLQKLKSGKYFNESRFLIGINSIYSNDLTAAKETLSKVEFNVDELSNLTYFELSGIALLERDFESYHEFNNQIFKDYYFYKKERESFQSIEADLKLHKDKSPFLAGLYSAVLPGAGKFYAGKRGQGVYSFVISSLLALQAFDSYQKAGPKSTRFIIYGGLFSLFHIGNVWSSALSVKRYNDEFYEAVDYRIKLDLHVPIRSFFD